MVARNFKPGMEWSSPLSAGRALALALCLVDGIWLLWVGLWPNQTVTEPSWLMVLLGGAAVLYLPGMAASISLGFKAASFWEGLGIWFFFSISLGLPLTLLTVALAWNAHDTLAMLGFSTLGLALGGLRPKTIHKRLFSVPRSPFKHVVWMVGCLGMGVIVALLQQQGFSLQEVAGESALHATYMLRYAQLPVLEQGSLAITAHRTAGTVIFLWEYMAALAGLASRTDLLYFWLHGRMLLPPAIIGGFLFFMRQVLPGSRRGYLPVTLALALASGRIMTLTGTRWAFLADRGTARFLGTFHHSDVAMDVFLPIMLGILVGFCRWLTWPWGLALAGGLVVTYFIHLREFLQLAIYVPIIFLAWWLLRDLSLGGIWRACRRLLVVTIVFTLMGASVLGLCQGMNSTAHSDDFVSQFAHENQLRHKAWQKLRDGLANNPMEIMHARELNHNKVGLVLVLGMLAGILLLSDRSPTVRLLALSTILCEFFVFSWILSRHLLWVTTYHEILMSELRYLFWPFYLIMPLAIIRTLELSRRALGALPLLRKLPHRPAMVLVSFLWGAMFYFLLARRTYPLGFTQGIIGDLGNWGLAAALLLGLASGWHRMPGALSPTLERNLVYLAFALMAGLAWLILPGAHSVVATLLLATSLAVLGWFYWQDRNHTRQPRPRPMPRPLLLAGGLLCIALALWPEHLNTWRFLLRPLPPAGNPIGAIL